MQTRTVEQVEDWEARPFSGGLSALHDLADDSFSGAVVADDAWLFAVNGRVVGVFEGSVEDFEGASGTVYEAPHLSLPLLFAMQETGGETQAKYYTEDTALEATDETLTASNFVGYVELSENVLSGDYYVAYYGGRSMSAAFVGSGSNETLLTGEEAFERAADEVGVYRVVSVDLDVVDLPEVESDDAREGADAAAAVASDDATDTAAGNAGGESTSVPDAGDATDGTPAESEEPAAGPATEADRDDAEREETDAAGGADATERTTADASASDDSSSGAATGPADDPGADTGDATGEPANASPSAASSEADESDGDERAEGAVADRTDRPDRTSAAARDPPSSGSGGTRRPAEADEESAASEGHDGERARERPPEGAAASADDDVFREEEAWRETTTIPALDPDETHADSGDPAAGASTASEDGERTDGQSRPDEGEGEGSARASRPRPDARSGERIERLRAAVEERDERIEALESELAEAEERVDDLSAELDERETELERLREERDDLEGRVAELEDELAEARAAAATGDASDDAPGGATEIDPAEALSGTNLFVRYESKADPTLDAIEDADATAEQINANLRLEHHTQFDATDASVDGSPFEQFLQSSAHYRFVSWIVRDLPYEILDTGHRSGLGDLFEAIARVDRAELEGTVDVEGDQGDVANETFDVVLRDRMGDPLVVADLEEGRDPVSGEQMAELVDAAETIAAGAETLAGALYVTASFFEPDALEVADERTDGGGFLRGSDRDSFVKTSRKRGFHLCLVEDRDESFHVTVPEL